MKVQNHHLKTAVFLLLFITIASAHASTPKEIIIVDMLQADLSLTESITMTLINDEENFSTTLPETAFNITVNNESMSNNSITLPMNCTLCKISITYDMDNAAKRDGPIQSFYRTLNFPKTPELFRYTVYLPKGYIVNTASNPAIVPSPTDIFTDGEHITVVWVESTPELPKQYYIRYQAPEQRESLLYVIKEDLTHPFIIMIIIMFLVIGIILGYKLKTVRMKKEKPKRTIPSSLLSPDEMAIVKYLKENNAQKHPVNQKDMGKSLDWSKSKVSAVLSNLYYKKIIEREKFGRNYKVKLVKIID